MKHNPNLQIALYGFIALLLGIVATVLKYSDLVTIPLTGVGASVAATGITNYLTTLGFAKIDINSIVQTLLYNSDFIRGEHTLDLTFTLQGDDFVRVTGEHRFRLTNLRNRRSKKKFAMYTDLGSWNKRGGFHSVVEPDGKLLEKDSLNTFLDAVNGKTYFKKEYPIDRDSGATFRFTTFGNYRRLDRLIWTVQDLSTGFQIRVVNNTGIKDPFIIKVNHHREREIVEGINKLSMADGQEITLVDFNCEVLPYQGFEIMWNFDSEESSKKNEPDSAGA